MMSATTPTPALAPIPAPISTPSSAIRQQTRHLALLLALCLSPAATLAHGDDDHADEKTRPPVSTNAGRTTDSSSADESRPRRLADGELFIPKPMQRRLGLLTQLVHIAPLAASVELNGRVIADPDHGGRVQAMFAGSLLPGPKGMPTPGRRVVQGEILAWLKPIDGAIEQANQKAALAEIEAQLSLARARATRLKQLEGAVPQKEIEAAQIELTAQQARYRHVKASIDTPEALKAPVGGIISATSPLLAGQIVDAREVLFEIIDPAHLAVEALAYDASLGPKLTSASAQADGTPLKLHFVGGGRQLREQALPLLFRIENKDAPLAVGQPLTVTVATRQQLQGSAVPRSALVKAADGSAAVWLHVAAERFSLRPIRHQPLDAQQVAVTAGLAEGERVVIQGALLLSQVR
jgi:multidrug efflux pump subunit AcrA (membrane-fusion protein)